MSPHHVQTRILLGHLHTRSDRPADTVSRADNLQSLVLWLTWRLPERLRRWRVRLPEDTGCGAVPFQARIAVLVLEIDDGAGAKRSACRFERVLLRSQM
jgi:hypothetical protein